MTKTVGIYSFSAGRSVLKVKFEEQAGKLIVVSLGSDKVLNGMHLL